MNIRTKLATELIEKIVPTSLPERPKPFDLEVNQSWKKLHQMPHEAKNKNMVLELWRYDGFFKLPGLCCQFIKFHLPKLESKKCQPVDIFVLALSFYNLVISFISSLCQPVNIDLKNK